MLSTVSRLETLGEIRSPCVAGRLRPLVRQVGLAEVLTLELGGLAATKLDGVFESLNKTWTVLFVEAKKD
jgi:hypothetical protein